jgi:hypothetical protein
MNEYGGGVMTKKSLLLGLALMVLFSLAGCIQFATVITVKPDGSGFIEETSLIRKDIIQQMQSFAEGMTGQPGEEKKAQAKTKSPDFFDEAKLKEAAKAYGEGVTYVSARKIDSADYEGFKAVYAFTDINKVRIKQDAKDKVPSPSPQGDADAGKKQKDITFSFSKGDPAELRIKIPIDKNAGAETPVQNKEPVSAAMPDEEGKALLMMMFKGMKMALSVNIDGTILESNASYRDKSKVTLLEADLGKMIENAETLQKFSQAKPETIEQMRAFMKDFPGMKVELNNEVRIKFH